MGSSRVHRTHANPPPEPDEPLRDTRRAPRARLWQSRVRTIVGLRGVLPLEPGFDVGPLAQAFAREVRHLRRHRGLPQADLALQLREQHGLRSHQATIDRIKKA